MTEKKVPSTESAELRRCAEEQRVLLHELQAHQIELEMQNAELCTTKDELAASLEQYSNYYAFSPVGYFILNYPQP